MNQKKTITKAKNLREDLENTLRALGDITGACPELEKLCNLLDGNWRTQLLPETFTGWLLLQRSGLSPPERATILAMSKGLDLKAIESALREQWNDSELKERDMRSKFDSRAMIAESDEEAHVATTTSMSGTGENPQSDEEDDFLLDSDLSDPEDQEAYTAAVSMHLEGRKKFKQGARNMAQARAIVKDLKKNRKFFGRRPSQQAHGAFPVKQKRPNQPTRNANSPHPNRAAGSRGPCFRCGATGHSIAQCPQPKPSAANLAEGQDEEHGDFIDMADNSDRERDRRRRGQSPKRARHGRTPSDDYRKTRTFTTQWEEADQNRATVLWTEEKLEAEKQRRRRAEAALEKVKKGILAGSRDGSSHSTKRGRSPPRHEARRSRRRSESENNKQEDRKRSE